MNAAVMKAGIQARRLDAHAHQMSTLQLLEQPIEHAGLGSAAYARVDGVPGVVAAGQCAPLAAVGRHVKDGVDHIKVVQSNVAALAQ